MIETALAAFRAPDIRRKLLFTLGILLIFRALTNVPIPNVNTAALANLFEGNPLLGVLNIFSGGGLAAAGSAVQQLTWPDNAPVDPEAEAKAEEAAAARTKGRKAKGRRAAAARAAGIVPVAAAEPEEPDEAEEAAESEEAGASEGGPEA